MSKQKIITISAVVVAIISAFLLGCFVGCNLCAKHKGFKKPSYIKFYEVNKNIGKQVANDEKQAIKIFVDNFEKCLNENLDENEKGDLNAIQNEILEIAKENHKIKVKITDLKNKNASLRRRLEGTETEEDPPFSSGYGRYHLPGRRPL